MYNNEGFDHKIHEQVDVGVGSFRVQTLLTPYEARELLRLLDGAGSLDSEVNKESLEFRLGLAADGRDGPLSGQPEYYQ